MKICPNCGSEVADSASFCSYCGSPVSTPDSFSNGAFSGQAQYQQAPQQQAQFQTQYQEAPQQQAQYQEAPQMQFQAQPQVQDQQVKGFDPNSYRPDATSVATPYYTFHDNMAASYQRDSGVATAIKVFMILGCVASLSFFCIPLIWRIPMTIHAFKKINNNEAMGTGFKVCTLLFTNLVAGILMFVIKDEDMPYER